MLTDTKVKKAKAPKGTRLKLWDKRGLGIRISNKNKIWIFKYSLEGRRRLMSLGAYPAMTLEEAQSKAAEARIKVKKGIDPLTEKQAKKQARLAAPTFAEALDEYYNNILEKTPSGKERRRLIKKDCLKIWGRRKIADINRRDVSLLLTEVAKRAPVTANRLHGVLVGLFNYCAESGIINSSPCTGMSKKTKEHGRKRVLSDEELKALWKALDLENKEIDIYHVTKLALKMILLTGQRPGEVVNMKWDDLDLKARVWNNRISKTKKDEDDEPSKVPLTGLALQVLEQARVYSGKSAYVFRSSHNKGPITRASLGRALVRHRQEIAVEEPFTPHDLRRTLRTRLAELGVENIIAERVLGHKLQGVLGTYNRHSYDKEKRAALQQWEARLRAIVGLTEQRMAKILPMRRK